MVIYKHRREVTDMFRLIKSIKKALDRYQRQQALIRRKKHVAEQHKLIYEGLEERGC